MWGSQAASQSLYLKSMFLLIFLYHFYFSICSRITNDTCLGTNCMVVLEAANGGSPDHNACRESIKVVSFEADSQGNRSKCSDRRTKE